MIEELEINNHPHAFELAWALGSLDVATILHFWFDLALVEIDYSRKKSDNFRRGTGSTDHFYSVFGDGSYSLPLEGFGNPRDVPVKVHYSSWLQKTRGQLCDD